MYVLSVVSKLLVISAVLVGANIWMGQIKHGVSKKTWFTGIYIGNTYNIN